MLKIIGLLNDYSKLEDFLVSDIQQWLPEKEDLTILENRVGNRMLYTQVVPETLKDLNFDFALIHKVIQLNQTEFYNKNLKRIDIPEEFIHYFPDINRLVTAFIDGILPFGITTFWIKSKTLGRKNLGTLVRPENLRKNTIITIGILGHQYQIKSNSFVIIPIPQSRADMIFTSSEATLLGKKIISIQVVTGQLGLIIDTRIS